MDELIMNHKKMSGSDAIYQMLKRRSDYVLIEKTQSKQLQAKHKEELKEDIIKAFIAGVQSEYDELNKTLNKLEDFKIDYVKERGKAEQYYKENHEPK